jgi:hypothetical protein
MRLKSLLIETDFGFRDERKDEKSESILPDYHNKEYWDKRYETETRDGQLSKNERSKQKDSSLYEWYVSFDKFAYYLQRDIKSNFPNQNIDKLLIYIPGCGNSPLAEDLYDIGK